MRCSSRARCRSFGDVAALLTRTVASAFRIGVQLSAPFLVFGLLFNLGLGVLSRLMPQMQVFFIGMPLSILVGFLILLLVVGAMMMTFLSYVEGVLHAARAVLVRSRPVADENNDADRTEDPTQKKLDDALKRGDVAKSQEVNTWFVIAGGALLLSAFAGPMASSLTTTLRGLIANSYQIPVDGRGLLSLSGRIGARGAGRDRDSVPAARCSRRSSAT